jgi:hypothetical protein
MVRSNLTRFQGQLKTRQQSDAESVRYYLKLSHMSRKAQVSSLCISHVCFQNSHIWPRRAWTQLGFRRNGLDHPRLVIPGTPTYRGMATDGAKPLRACSPRNSLSFEPSLFQPGRPTLALYHPDPCPTCFLPDTMSPVRSALPSRLTLL